MFLTCKLQLEEMRRLMSGQFKELEVACSSFSLFSEAPFLIIITTCYTQNMLNDRMNKAPPMMLPDSDEYPIPRRAQPPPPAIDVASSSRSLFHIASLLTIKLTTPLPISAACSHRKDG